MALLLMSSRFPMGVATMYRILASGCILILLIFIIYSCTPRIIANEDILTKAQKKDEIKNVIQKKASTKQDQKKESDSEISLYLDENNDVNIISEIEVILPSEHNIEITQNFINSLELSIYNKNIKNLSLNINTYSDKQHLHDIIDAKIQPGKIYVDQLTSDDTENINKYCSYGVVFFPLHPKDN